MRIDFFAFIVEVILVVTAVHNPFGKQVSMAKQTNKEITKPWINNRPPRTRTVRDGRQKDEPRGRIPKAGGIYSSDGRNPSVVACLIRFNFRTLVTEV